MHEHELLTAWARVLGGACRYTAMSTVDAVVPAPGETEAFTALSALSRALAEEGKVSALVRA
ncbi:hypothetical protein EON66_07455 [archaeon]|nr:MAG: hypothetical protein EON66_07455 [archaeon]